MTYTSLECGNCKNDIDNEATEIDLVDENVTVLVSCYQCGAYTTHEFKKSDIRNVNASGL